MASNEMMDESSSDGDNGDENDDFDIESALDSISFIEEELIIEGQQSGQQIVGHRS